VEVQQNRSETGCELGLALLGLDHTDEAGANLREIEVILWQGGQIVVGDETLFLRWTNMRGLERPTIKSIASILAPFCRAALFAERSQNLSFQKCQQVSRFQETGKFLVTAKPSKWIGAKAACRLNGHQDPLLIGLSWSVVSCLEWLRYLHDTQMALPCCVG